MCFGSATDLWGTNLSFGEIVIIYQEDLYLSSVKKQKVFSNRINMIAMIKNLLKKEESHKGNIQIPSFPESDIMEVREFAKNGWKLGSTHGLSHWQRVERNGIILSMENGRIRDDINIKVVRFFAYLHDKCRLNDWTDIEHGVRSANMLPTIRETILKDFTDEEVSLLENACRYHTTAHRTGNPTIDVCFDADRLDLGRVGILPDPKRMATKQGAYYASNLHLINRLGAL